MKKFIFMSVLVSLFTACSKDTDTPTTMTADAVQEVATEVDANATTDTAPVKVPEDVSPVTEPAPVDAAAGE
jgi:hypothetical protein